MIVYMVYVVYYNSIVRELHVKRDIDISQERIQFLYLMLWKQKSMFHIYEIHESFLGRYRVILTREVRERFTNNATYFLEGKGQFFLEDKHSYFKFYGFEGTPFFLPNFVTSIVLIQEFCRQQLQWSSFFNQKCKIQFIHIPFLVAGVHVKNLSHLREVVGNYEFNLFKVQKWRDLIAKEVQLVTSIFLDIQTSLESLVRKKLKETQEAQKQSLGLISRNSRKENRRRDRHVVESPSQVSFQ